MTKAFIQSILDKIASDLPTVKHKGVYNDDFSQLDDGKKASFNFPAVFLSFPENVPYTDYGSGVQKTDEFTIRLYIAQKFMTDVDVLDIFDLKQAVYLAFKGFSPDDSSSSMTRINEIPDESRRGYYIFEQDYTVKLIDTSGHIYNKRVLIETFTIETEANLNIDPATVDGVRTDKEIQ